MLEQMLNEHQLCIYRKLKAELKVARFEGKAYRTVTVRCVDTGKEICLL